MAEQARRRTEVVVVGAGYAGLAAALRLHQAGVDVVVLEARDRVGGRTYSEILPDGTTVDNGGQWTGPTQYRIQALAEEMGVVTFLSHDEGNNIEYREGQIHQYVGPVPSSNPNLAADVVELTLELDMMSLEVPLEEPWTAERAEQWDSITFQGWIDENARSAQVAAELGLFIEAVFSIQPRDVSLLHVLFYVHSAGGVQKLISVSGGAQESRFRGGAQETAKRVATALGNRVALGAPVHLIEHGQAGVVAYADSIRVEAQLAIVAVPPILAGRIRYRPSLPGARDQLTQRIPMGTIYKVHCVYPEPFWRADGLTGQASSDTGPVRVTFDNSPEDGAKGVLLAFVEGQEGRRLSRVSPEQRKTEVIGCLVRYFGDRAAAPELYTEMAWAEEEFTRGCYGGAFPPGVWTGFGEALRAPIGVLHWAGTETATVWNGYIDGAVSSGERAAQEVLAALGRTATAAAASASVGGA